MREIAQTAEVAQNDPTLAIVQYSVCFCYTCIHLATKVLTMLNSCSIFPAQNVTAIAIVFFYLAWNLTKVSDKDVYLVKFIAQT